MNGCGRMLNPSFILFLTTSFVKNPKFDFLNTLSVFDSCFLHIISASQTLEIFHVFIPKTLLYLNPLFFLNLLLYLKYINYAECYEVEKEEEEKKFVCF